MNTNDLFVFCFCREMLDISDSSSDSKLFRTSNGCQQPDSYTSPKVMVRVMALSYLRNDILY